MRAGGDRGAGTVLVVGLVALALVLLTAVLALVRVTEARGRAQAAADLGALAAAATLQAGDGAPCVLAGRTVAANGARMVGCDVEPPEVRVRAEVPVGGLTAAAAARAGPVDVLGGSG